MEAYPGNSHRSKENLPEKDAPKKVERITTGDAIQRKRPLGKRMMETFFGGDARSVTSYVFQDVLLPAAKDMIADAVSQAVERMIFGESRSNSRRGGRPGGHNSFVNYSGFSRDRDPRREEPRTISRRSRVVQEFDEILLETRVEAEAVLERLDDILERYGTVTIADLYDLVGITGYHTDEKYGWTNLKRASVDRTRNGRYVLNLPQPEPID